MWTPRSESSRSPSTDWLGFSTAGFDSAVGGVYWPGLIFPNTVFSFPSPPRPLPLDSPGNPLFWRPGGHERSQVLSGIQDIHGHLWSHLRPLESRCFPPYERLGGHGNEPPVRLHDPIPGRGGDGLRQVVKDLLPASQPQQPSFGSNHIIPAASGVAVSVAEKRRKKRQ